MESILHLIDKSIVATLSLEQLKENFELESIKKGNVLCLQGDLCDKVHILLKGSLVVEKLDESGDYFSIKLFEEQAVIGGSLVFGTKKIYPNTICAVTNCKVLTIKRENLFNLFFENRDLLRKFLNSISDNTLYVSEKLSDAVQLTLRQKLKAYLLAESKRQNSNTIILPITKTRLASLLGVRRSSLSRELSYMQSEKLLFYVNRSVFLLPRLRESE